MEDKKIVELLWQRLQSGLEALQCKFGNLIFTISMNILQVREDAQECVNDTYLALWNAIPPAQPDPLTAYVCRTCRNVALKRLRANAARKLGRGYTLSLDELAEYIPDERMAQCLDARALGRAIDDFLAGQSAQNRVLFLRRYWFGDSVADAARAVGISANAAAVRLLRLRERLKIYLTEREFYDE